MSGQAHMPDHRDDLTRTLQRYERSPQTAFVLGGHETSYAEFFARAHRLATELCGNSTRLACIPTLDRLAHAVSVVACIIAEVPFTGSRIGGGLEREGVLTAGAQIVAMPSWLSSLAPKESGGFPEKLAYMIATSGTTATPKQVAVPRRSLAWHVTAVRSAYELQAEDRILHSTNLSFDVAYEELLPSLAAGAAIIACPSNFAFTPSQLQQFVHDERISVVNLPASVASAWLAAIAKRDLRLPDHLRLLIAGSESLWSDAVTNFRRCRSDESRFLNAYGKTETTITNLIFDTDLLPDGYVGPVPIGQVLDGLSTSLASVQGHAHPELIIEGPCVAFVDDQVVGGKQGHATGDLVSLGPYGFIYEGRADSQVKVRGIRVNLEALDAIVRTIPGVSGALSCVGSRGRRLELFVQQDMANLSSDDILAQLRRDNRVTLAPDKVTFVADLPVASTGKALRQVPEPEWIQPTAEPAPQEAPLSLQRVWERVLGLSEMPNAWLADGGDSLTAVEFITAAEDIVGFQLPGDLMSADPSFATVLARIAELSEPATDIPRLPLSPQQEALLPWLFPVPAGAQEQVRYIRTDCEFGPAGNIPDWLSMLSSARAVQSHLKQDQRFWSGRDIEDGCAGEDCSAWIPPKRLDFPLQSLILWRHTSCSPQGLTLQVHQVVADTHSADLLANRLLDGKEGRDDAQDGWANYVRGVKRIDVLSAASEIHDWAATPDWRRLPPQPVWACTENLGERKATVRRRYRAAANARGLTEFQALLADFAASAAPFATGTHFPVAHAMNMRPSRFEPAVGCFASTRLTRHPAIGADVIVPSASSGLPGELIAWALNRPALDALKFTFEDVSLRAHNPRITTPRQTNATRRHFSVSVQADGDTLRVECAFRYDSLAESDALCLLDDFWCRVVGGES